MNLLELVKIAGPGGLAGALVGLALVSWVRPETTQGALILMLLSVASVGVLVGLVGLVWRRRTPPDTEKTDAGKPGAGKPPAQTPRPRRPRGGKGG